MTKISRKTAYPLKNPVVGDFFVGTDSENGNRTVSFGFEYSANLISKLNGILLINYIFKTSENISFDVLTGGVFLSEGNELAIDSVTKLYINKETLAEDDLTDLFLFIKENSSEFYIQLKNANNLNAPVFFNITSVVNNTSHFIFNVNIHKSNDLQPNLVPFDNYFFGFDIKQNLTKTSELENDGADGVNPFITSEDVPEYTTNIVANQLLLYKDGVQVSSVDLTIYLDDTNLARIIGGTIDPETGIVTFTRDDDTTFTIDFSSLIDVQPTKTSDLTNDGNGTGSPFATEQYVDDADQVLQEQIDILNNFTPTPTTSFTGQPYMAWSGTGFKHDYNLPSYYIEGVLYPAIMGSITPVIDTDVNPRYVVFYVDTTGINYRQGDAEVNPRKPTTDPTTEIYITDFLVLPGATEPDGVAQNVMYNEQDPGEWTFSSNHANITAGNTTDPLDGLECINVANSVSGTYFELTAPEPQSIVAADGFKFWNRPISAVVFNRGWTVQFFNGTTPVSDVINFKRANNNGPNISVPEYFTDTSKYHLHIINYSALNFDQNTFNKVRFTFIGTISMKFDYLALMTSGGGFGVSPDKKGIKTIITEDGIKTVETPEASVELGGSGGVTTYVDPVTGKIVVSGQSLSNRIDQYENYGEKVFKQAWINVTGTGVIADLDLSATASLSLNLTGTISELQSVFYDSLVEPPYTGSIGFIKNSQAGDVLIPHDELSSLVGRFVFKHPTAKDLVLKPGQVLALKTNGIADGYWEIIGLFLDETNLMNLTDDQDVDGNKTFLQPVSGVVATADEHFVPKAQMDEALALKLDASAYNDRYKGKYTSLGALETAHPTANAGDYAQVDAGSGSDVVNYNYDLEEGWIEGGSGSGATDTDALPEGSSNLYFSTARVLATVLTGISFVTGGAIVSTDSILVAFGKIQKQITDLISDSKKVELSYALSDETTNLTVGTLITFRMPFAMILTSVRASVNTAPTVSSIIVDVKEGGASVFSTLLSIDATEKTSVTAATPAVISDTSLADDAEITISTTQIGSGVAGAGLKITLIGTRT